jgi:NADH:ubiquinone oxidoreductase subunit 6 (subunit J)
MLLNLGHADWRDLRGPFGGLICGAIGVGFLALVGRRIVGGAAAIGSSSTSDAIRQAASEQGVVAVVARPLFADYIVVLEVTGLLLLVSMVGTILLARRRSA